MNTKIIEPHSKTQDVTTQVKERVSELRLAQTKWSQTSFNERLAILKNMRKILSAESDYYARSISQENGKTELESLSQEVIPVLDTLVFLEKNAESILSNKSLQLETKQFYFKGKENEVVYSPYGVIGILGTWNYPFVLSLTQILFALIAGNTVIFKGSEWSERVTDLIGELLRKSGFSEKIFHIFTSDALGGKALCDAGCDKYILTGSRKTGKLVLKSLAENLKPAVVELSGFDPYIILTDANWELATRTLLWASFQYSGQTCVAPRRVFILKSDKEKFLSAFKKNWDSSKEYIEQQGMLRSAHFGKSEKEKIQKLKDRGMTLEFGEDISDLESAFVTPQVYSGLSSKDLKDMDLMSPTIFLIECESEQMLIKSMNQSSFALGASLWTSSKDKARKMTPNIEGGQVWVNDSIFSVALGEVSFGGYKDSGFGKTRGKEGLLEMVHQKFVSYDWRKKRFTKHLPPYEKNSFQILTQIQRMLYLDSFGSKMKALNELIQVILFKK